MAMVGNIHYDWYDKRYVQYQMIVYESCFLVEMIIQFFRKVQPDGHTKELDDILEISKHYL